MIDTGANATSVDEDRLRLAGITPSGAVATVHGVAGPKTMHYYHVELKLVLQPLTSGSPIEWSHRIQALGRQPATAAPQQGLLGMDILQHCFLELDGPKGRFLLAR